MKVKKSWKEKAKVNKGITLIALVVTIVVLIILAGITIASLTGEKGIIKEARTAKELSEKAALEELVELAIIKAEQKHRNPTIDNVIEELKNNKVISKDDQVNKETGSIVTDAGYEITGKLDDYIGKVSVGDGNTSGGDENTSQGGNSTGGGDTPESPKLTLPTLSDSTPYLPDENTTVISNNPDTGITIKDSKNNEWVWVEVPKSIYTNTTYNEGTAPASATDYAKIESTMQAYANDYKPYKINDTYYSTDQHGFANQTAYNNWKNSMLKSVYENGGFYIGKYEVGTQTPRTSETDALTTPLIQRDQYPYTYVTCKQAQDLSKQLAIGGKTSSLMFGIQWNLVLKFIEAKGIKTKNEIIGNSSSWGNHSNSAFNVERGKYSIDSGKTYEQIRESYSKESSTNILLTTGATDRNSALGIYDLAGNVLERTLEYSNLESKPCCMAGGFFSSGGFDFPPTERMYHAVSTAAPGVGFRTALW